MNLQCRRDLAQLYKAFIPSGVSGVLASLSLCRREIENYFCTEDVLIAYAQYDQPDDLFGKAEAQRRKTAMREAIEEVGNALRTLNRPDPWSPDIKASDEFLEPLFRAFFRKLGLPLQLRKSEYHKLASFVPRERVDGEIAEKLDPFSSSRKGANRARRDQPLPACDNR